MCRARGRWKEDATAMSAGPQHWAALSLKSLTSARALLIINTPAVTLATTLLIQHGVPDIFTASQKSKFALRQPSKPSRTLNTRPTMVKIRLLTLLTIQNTCNNLKNSKLKTLVPIAQNIYGRLLRDCGTLCAHARAHTRCKASLSMASGLIVLDVSILNHLAGVIREWQSWAVKYLQAAGCSKRINAWYPMWGTWFARKYEHKVDYKPFKV